MRGFGVIGVALALALAVAAPARAQGEIRVALGDIASVETLNLLIALEHVRERGVEVELIEYNAEDLANQAVVNGDADVGVGVPYAIIQRVDAPIRMFFQMSALRFFAVADRAAHPDWASLNGQPFAVQGRGSGSEAMARLVESREGIMFSEIIYVPGSEVRALALLEGNIKATFVDIANRDLVLREGGDRFHVLPVEGVNATDEALFARQDWLDANADTVQILLEELLKTWRQINADPAWAAAERERLGLLPDLPADLAGEIGPYFEQSVAAQTFPDNGGDEASATSDFGFYSLSEQLEGDPATLKVEDFWYFAPLERARQALGG